jgi:neopullulanase
LSPAIPSWVKDAVFYAIFPDRFARSSNLPKPANLEPWDSPPTLHGYKGGDLEGVREKLDYLVDLGVTALYFNPIFQSASNHRYHTHDYYRVDPLLGGDQAFGDLLEAAHRRGLRVLLDGVFNHASRGLYQFHSLLELGPQSPYLNWFHVHGWPLNAYGEGPPNYGAWWGLPALPKFNTATPDVREFLWRAGCHWIERGIDGWRLDVPTEINDDSFWREFRARVRAANPEAYLVAEIWHDAQHWLQGDQFDATMNYQFARACIGFFAGHTLDHSLVEGKGYSPVTPLDAPQFAAFIERQVSLYSWEVTAAQMNLLDSHDTARFLTIARQDETALRLATLFQMTYPGAPSIYYGDEVGLQGGNDPDCRRAMPWDSAQWNQGLRDYIRQAIALRRAHPALRHGEFKSLHAAEMVYSFGRRSGEAAFVVVLNASTRTMNAEIPVGGFLEDGARLDHVWQAHGHHNVVGGRIRDLKLPPRSGRVLKAG